MKTQRFLMVLTVVNLAILVFTAATFGGVRHAAAQDVAPMLRGRGLEIVDEQGRVRASISVLPATTSEQGDRSRETVLLRLITERGRPGVKIGTSEETSGLSLTGPSGTRDTYVILEAKGHTSSLRLRNENGKQQDVTP